jgi:hypothetical protein
MEVALAGKSEIGSMFISVEYVLTYTHLNCENTMHQLQAIFYRGCPCGEE